MPERKSNLGHWVVVDVNNLVEVLHDNFGDRCKLFEVIAPLWGDVHVQGDGCQVTNCNLKELKEEQI